MTNEQVLLRLHNIRADLERSLSEVSGMIEDMREGDKQNESQSKRSLVDSFSEDKESFIAP